jgi:RecB family exonuclease/inactivated superfamily I helicase
MTAGDEVHQGLLVGGRFPELEHALCERVRELKSGRPLRPLTVVVGSGAVRTRISDLLVRELTAVANVEVVTLSRMARDRVARAQGAPVTVLGGVARERLVRRLVDGRLADLPYFRPVATRPHFAAALAATFADLREARVPADDTWTDAVAAAGPGGRLDERAADLGLVYAAYDAQLSALAATDSAGLLERAAQAPTVEAHVLLYGIYDLNMSQEALVRVLLAAGADAFVPLPAGVPGDRTTAVPVAETCGLTFESSPAPASALDKDRLSAVWTGGRSLSFAGDGSLEVVSIADERAEAREAARLVVGAAEEGVRLDECAVVVPHGSDVERVAGAFLAAGLPVACRLPDHSPGAALVARLLDVVSPRVGEPFARRTVVDLLSVVPLRGRPAGADDIAMWLDEAREAGVVAGRDQWAEHVLRRRRGLEVRVERLESGDDDVYGDDDEALAGRVDHARRRLRATRALEAPVLRLTAAARGLPERASWAQWAGAFATVMVEVFDPDAAAAGQDVAARLLALEVLGEVVDLRTAADTLRELIAGETVQEGRAGRSGVAVLTPLDLRGLSFSTVVFTGLAEGGFPVRARPDPILGDGARRAVAEALAVRLPLAEDRDAESQLLFGFACEAATRHLVLMVPRTDAATGRPRLPSRLLLRVASLAAEHPVGLDEFLSGRSLAPVWRRVGGPPAFAADVVWIDERERDVAVLADLAGRRGRAAALAYLGSVLGRPGAAERRTAAWRAARSPSVGSWDGLLGADARAAMAARHPFRAELYPTGLERYVTCPFTFLVRNVLGLRAPEEPGESLEMDAMEFGILAHAILEDVYQAVILRDLDLDAALDELQTAWRERCAEAEDKGVTGAALAWDIRREVLLADLRLSLANDPVFVPGGGRPLDVEWRFGDRHGNAVTLDLEGAPGVRFAGRLDRVDHTPAGARVLDYKTGAGSSERTRLDEGLSVQLPVYQLAVRQRWASLAPGRDEPAEVSSAYRMVTRRGQFKDLALGDDEASAQARLRDLVQGALELVDAGLFPRSPRGKCDYCDIRYACGVSEWARGRKREQDEIVPVVTLQSPPPKGGDGG